MKTRVYRIVSVCMVLGFVLALAGCRAALEDAAKLSEYEIGGESVPSINSVAGEREVIGVESSTSNGVPSKQYTYASASVYDDLWAYVQKLMDEGWLVTQDINLKTVPGSGQLGRPALEEGQILLLSFTYEDGKYAIKVTKAKGTIETGETADAETLPTSAGKPAAATKPASNKDTEVSGDTHAAAGITGSWSYFDDSEDLKKQTFYVFQEDGAYVQLDISIVTEQYLSVTAYRGKYEISGDKLLVTGREKTSYSAASLEDAIEQAEEMIYTPLEDQEEVFAWDGADRLLIGGIELAREE
ncbi:MAG: hypothetical protein ACOYJC_05840 [Christensenellales bacterium]|jgi:hypothetical protein